MFPATFGVMLLAYPLNTLFYTPDSLGSNVLIQASFVGLFLGLYMLVSTCCKECLKTRRQLIIWLLGF